MKNENRYMKKYKHFRADKNIRNDKDKVAAELTDVDVIKVLLTAPDTTSTTAATTPAASNGVSKKQNVGVKVSLNNTYAHISAMLTLLLSLIG